MLLPLSAYRKAIVAALVALLGPIATYVASAGDWSWRALAGSVLSGLIAGGATYGVTNTPPGEVTPAHPSGDAGTYPTL